AEDGIRDFHVTGVQTCALPISRVGGVRPARHSPEGSHVTERILLTGAGGRIGTLLRPRMTRPGRVLRLHDRRPLEPGPGVEVVRSEERRVGKEGREWASGTHRG